LILRLNFQFLNKGVGGGGVVGGGERVGGRAEEGVVKGGEGLVREEKGLE
jgi:hypothetical protein